MIEFRVEPTEEIKAYLKRALHKINTIAGIVSGVFMLGIIWAFTALLWKEDYVFWFTGAFTFGCVLCVLYYSSTKTKEFRKEFESSMPSTVLIDTDEQTLETMGEAEACYKCHKIEDVKRVLDKGTFYAIIFYRPNLDRRFICQKDYIVQGTIEEFEQLFEGKIVREKDNIK